MVKFECQRCNYNTPIKCNYEKHLKTKKHVKNMSEILEDSEKCGKYVEKSIHFTCQFCQNQYQTNRGLSKHVRNCLLRKHSFESKI